MPRPIIQNVIFDNGPGDFDYIHPNDDDIIGWKVRKKSIAGDIWQCLTGSKPKAEIILYDHPRRGRGRRYYDDDRRFGPWRVGSDFSPPAFFEEEEWYEEEQEGYDCPGCIFCYEYTDLGRNHRPGPRPGHGIWQYDYPVGGGYEWDQPAVQAWDPAPFWDPGWMPIPPRRRRGGREPTPMEEILSDLQFEKVRLMRQRLAEMRHERRYNEWPRGSSLQHHRRRADRIEELDEQIEALQRRQHGMGREWDSDDDSDD